MRRVFGLFIAACFSLAAQTVGVVPTIYRVSQLIPAAHATSNCDPTTGLRTGGVACYNDLAYINAATALGVAGNPVKIVFDVSIGVGGCILLPTIPYVELEGTGQTGVFMLAASNSTVISNNFTGNVAGTCLKLFDSLTPSTATGSVSIHGLYINGNRGTYPNGNCNNGDARCGNSSGPWATCIQLGNLAYVEVLNVHIQDCPTYGIYGSNVTRFVARGNTVISPSLGTNTDGVHLSGTTGSCDVSDSYFEVGDDSVALNAPEGYVGSIGPCTIANNVHKNVISFVRLYAGGSTYTIGPVVGSNLVGNYADDNALGSTGFRLGNTGPGAVDSINLTLSNIDATGPQSPIEVTEDVGNLSITNFRWTPTAAKPFIHLTASSLISNYTCTQCTIYRGSGGSSLGYWGQLASGSTIKYHECNECNVINATSNATAAIAYGWDVPAGSAITTFVLTAMNPALQPTLTNGNQWARITNFSGAGVAAYYRNTTYANLPPATYTGLAATISDSTTQTWGATAAGSSSSFAQVGSNGTNWTVTGK